jgi:hypothetical protein
MKLYPPKEIYVKRNRKKGIQQELEEQRKRRQKERAESK